MKLLLLAILIFVVVFRRDALGALVGAVKKAPKQFHEGEARAADPASFAKPVNEPPDESARGG
jgi:hypothetical protein